jgi:hypothetical protein
MFHKALSMAQPWDINREFSASAASERSHSGEMMIWYAIHRAAGAVCH